MKNSMFKTKLNPLTFGVSMLCFLFTLTAHSQWSPGTITADIYRTGNTGIGYSSMPSSFCTPFMVNGSMNLSTGNSFRINCIPVLDLTGTNNLFVGEFAGQNISTGQDNTFLGYGSGILTTTGSSNTFLGFQSGLNNTTGNSNTFIGQQAGMGNAT